MNRLKTTDTGGFPLSLDDFRFLDEAQREAFVAVVKMLIGDADYAILQGCEVVDTEQGDVWSCTEGYVFFNGEVFYVPANEVYHPLGAYQLYFGEDVSYETPEGLKTFEDTNDHETYEIRRAKLISSATPPVGYMPYSADDVLTLLSTRLNLYQQPVETGFEESALSSANVTGVGGAIDTISGTLAYKKIGKTAFVAIDLTVSVTSTCTSITITLPANLRNKLSTIYDTALIHNLQSARTDTIYRLMAWNVNNKLSIAHLDAAEGLDVQGYHFYGQMFFECE